MDGKCKKMDACFLEFHKETLNPGRNITSRTAEVVKKNLPAIPQELMSSFCRQRIFIRIRYLNRLHKEKKSAGILKQKFRHDTCRKSTKKIKKNC